MFKRRTILNASLISLLLLSSSAIASQRFHCRDLFVSNSEFLREQARQEVEESKKEFLARGEKVLRDKYKEVLEEIKTEDVPEAVRPILDQIMSRPDWLPPDQYLIDPGSMAKDYGLEVRLTAQFIKEYRSWKEKLEASESFTAEEISRVDMNVYARALLRNGNFNIRELANLSLIYDNLFGSHYYEMAQEIEIYDLGHFLTVRRKLAKAQGFFFQRIGYEDRKKEAEKLGTWGQQQAASKKPAPLKEQRRVVIVKALAKVFGSVIPPLREVILDIFNIIEPASPVDPIGTNIAKQYLELRWMPETLRHFRLILEKFERDLEASPEAIFKEGKNVFDLALEATQGDQERAIVLIGLMSIQRKALARNLARHYQSAGTYHRYASSLEDTVDLYYLITDISETIDVRKGIEKGPPQDRHQFMYPTVEARMSNNKFYHFWSEAFFAYHLRKMGHEERWVQFGLSNVGRVYEAMTSITGMELYLGLGLDPWESFLGTRMLQDIRLHEEGAKYGIAKFRELDLQGKVHQGEPRPKDLDRQGFRE